MRYIEYNPAEHASLSREKRNRPRRRGLTWTPEQLAAWLRVATKDHDAALWVLVATAGMHRSELAGAERDLLDLDGEALDVADTRVVVDCAARESDGKSDSGNRTISLDPLTVAFLRRTSTGWTRSARRSVRPTGTTASCSATQTDARCTQTPSRGDSTDSWMPPTSPRSDSTTLPHVCDPLARRRGQPEDRQRTDRPCEHVLHSPDLHQQVDGPRPPGGRRRRSDLRSCRG
jgi:hypothetical protein